MASGFSIPGADPVSADSELLPAAIALRIETSVVQFEAKFAPYRIFVAGQLPGWIEEYRKELREIALLCLRRELAGSGSGVGGPR